MAFWDSSAVVLLCCRQSASVQRRRLLKQLGRMIAWWGTPVEARSAIARLTREGELVDAQRVAALNSLEQLRRNWSEISATEAVREIALSLPGDYGLERR